MSRGKAKVFSLFLLFCSLGMVLFGCQGNSSKSSNNGKVTLTIWDNYGSSTPIKPLISKFEEKHPNIKINFQALPWDDFWDKLAVGASSGNLPDIATTGLMFDPKYTNLGIYADLSSLSNGKINGKNIDSVFSKGSLDAAKKDGKLYGIPYDFDAYALYYRQDLLKEAGVKEPPKNWDELVSVGKKLTKDTNGDGKIDRYAFVVQPTWTQFEPFLRANGGRILNKEGTKAAFNSPEGVKALQFYTDLVNKYKIATLWTKDKGDVTKGLKDGTIAMFMNGPYMMGQLKKAAPELKGDWKISMPLSNKELGTHIGGTYLSIFKNSNHKKEAWEFVEYLLQKENEVEVYKTSGAGPAYLPANNSKEIDKPSPYFDNQKPMEVFQKALKKGTSYPIVSEWQEATKELEEAEEKALFQKETPKKALDEAAQKVNELLSQDQ